MEKTKKVPVLRFPGFDGDWGSKKLGDITKSVMYGMNSSAIEFDGEHKYIRITDIDEESRQYCPKPITSPDGRIDERYKLNEGDILFARTGASVGKSYLYNIKDGNLYFAGFLIRFSITGATPTFVFQLTLKNSYSKWVNLMSMRSGQPGINAEEYKSLKLPLPSLLEQQKIASFLSSVDDKIQQLQKKKDLLKQYKMGVMQKIFNKEIRFKDEDGQDFPDWQSRKLGEVSQRMISRNKEAKVKHVLTNSAIQGIVSQQDYFDNDVANQNNLFNYYIVEIDDFVYNPRISNAAPVGPIKRNTTSLGVMSPLYTVFKFTEGNLKFFEQYFETTAWYDFMKSIANYGARHDRMNISNTDFFKLPLPFPSIPEQKKIANFLSSIDDKVTLVNKQLDQTKRFKKGLLQQMFV